MWAQSAAAACSALHGESYLAAPTHRGATGLSRSSVSRTRSHVRRVPPLTLCVFTCQGKKRWRPRSSSSLCYSRVPIDWLQHWVCLCVSVSRYRRRKTKTTPLRQRPHLRLKKGAKNGWTDNLSLFSGVYIEDMDIMSLFITLCLSLFYSPFKTFSVGILQSVSAKIWLQPFMLIWQLQYTSQTHYLDDSMWLYIPSKQHSSKW